MSFGGMIIGYAVRGWEVEMGKLSLLRLSGSPVDFKKGDAIVLRNFGRLSVWFGVAGVVQTGYPGMTFACRSTRARGCQKKAHIPRILSWSELKIFLRSGVGLGTSPLGISLASIFHTELQAHIGIDCWVFRKSLLGSWYGE
jgi:hypothetical protein